ncbi:MAG: hypothetical protein K9J37_03135 [Saprospiraceae bacterium]|nr:hypothetical protein [Saprospiraceae bacterium]MCF8248876.1 hypothetical protein [Saprospiraceae bacterium]MCF8279601.1 hypothetical protein [Bacteroidales bacterium]MCF8310161.1 hypothetical protein [Saprospiraceae bacterium]MCF8439061.1 hypothetical protein [Saprospiraceae bacterium]
MTKKLPLIITASAVALTFVAIMLYQGGYISELEQTIQKKEKQILVVSQKLDDQVEISTALEAQLQVYKDSVNVLQLQNQALHTKIETLKGTISKLHKIVQKHDDKVSELTAEIKRLRESGSNDAKKIKDLEQQREDLLKKMEEIDHERIALIEAKKESEKAKQNNNGKIESLNNSARVEIDKVDEAPLLPALPAINQSPAEPTPDGGSPKVSEEMQSAIISRQQERLANIMTKTEVKFSTISLRNREDSNELKKIKKSDNEWRYTFIDFDLDNVDKEAIIDETFVLQVYDIDNKEVVPFNEKNMAFPNSEMGAHGYKFKYDGKPVSVRYINTQPKEGSNYEIRLVYFKNGLTFKLANGARKIVESGRVTID